MTTDEKTRDLVKVTVNLIPEAYEAVTKIAESLGSTHTDTINRAVQLYRHIAESIPGMSLTIDELDGKKIVLVCLKNETRARSTVSPHEPTKACLPIHCHIHNVDEPDKGAYIQCNECGHVYRTAGDLRRVSRRILAVRDGLRGISWRGRVELLWAWLTVRASRLFSCPLCGHNFF